MNNHLLQIEKAHPFKKRTNPGAQRIHLSDDHVTYHYRAKGFAARSLEKFAFFVTLLISAKHQ
jgi:hypothetical protein